MSYIFNAPANTEKMSRTGLEPKKSWATNLSREQRKRGPPKPFVTRLIDAPPMSKHLVSRVPRARQRTPRLDGPVFPSGQDRRDLSFGGGAPVRPLTCRGKGKLGGETRLPMVRKIKQWVPIDGTRWRNEVANSHESHAVGVHYGVAHGCVLAPLRELPNTAGLCGLCGLRHGGPGATLHQTRNRDSL